MGALVDSAIEEFGRIDVLFINHGVGHSAAWDGTTDEIWDTAISVNLTGAWRTARVVIPHMIRNGGGSIIFTTSAATKTTYYNLSHYTASKAGVAGLMRTLAAELAPHSIRVNAIAPSAVDTPLGFNKPTSTSSPGARDPRKRTRCAFTKRSTCSRWGCSSRGTSPVRRCSWPPTRRATSPASSCRSMPGPPSSLLASRRPRVRSWRICGSKSQRRMRERRRASKLPLAAWRAGWPASQPRRRRPARRRGG